MFPAKWRPKSPDVVFTLLNWPIGSEDRVLALPPERWAQMVQKLKNQSLSEPRVAALEQVLAESACQLSLDKAGRLCLPEEMARAAGIGNEVEFVGRLDKFELWNPAARESVRVENRKLAAEVLQEIDL